MDLVEVYKIIYYGPEDGFQGIIESLDNEHDTQILFKNMNIEEDVMYDLEHFYRSFRYWPEYNKEASFGEPLNMFHVMLHGPDKACINATSDFALDFYLFGRFYAYMAHRSIEYGPTMISTPLDKVIWIEGNRCLKIFYAIFENAAEAHVKLKWTKVDCAFNLYGSIYAWTTAVKDPFYKSLLFFKDDKSVDCETVEPGNEKDVSMSRSFVAVPIGSELILEICLSGGDNNKIVPKSAVFKCVKGLPNSHCKISCSNWEIEVEVIWRYKWSGRLKSPDLSEEEV